MEKIKLKHLVLLILLWLKHWKKYFIPLMVKYNSYISIVHAFPDKERLSLALAH